MHPADIKRMTDQLERQVEEGHPEAVRLAELAKRQAFVRLMLRGMRGALRLGSPQERAYHELSQEAYRILSEFNQARRGASKPPASPGDAVMEAVEDLGGTGPWEFSRIREWLRAMWGWTYEQAERVAVLAMSDRRFWFMPGDPLKGQDDMIWRTVEEEAL